MTKEFACNKFFINSSKCETISFGIGKPPGLKTDNICMPDKPHCNYLDVHLDPQFPRKHQLRSNKNEQILRTDVQSQVYEPREMSSKFLYFIILMLKL